MKKDEIINVLKIIQDKIKNKKINWVLLGSASLLLQGVDINPKDIDIFTNKPGAFDFYDSLKEFTLHNIRHSAGPGGDLLSWFCKYKINEIEVEVNGDAEIKDGKGGWFKSDSLQKRKNLNVNGIEIPILSIKDELEQTKKRIREKDNKKIKIIEDFLKNAC